MCKNSAYNKQQPKRGKLQGAPLLEATGISKARRTRACCYLPHASRTTACLERGDSQEDGVQTAAKLAARTLTAIGGATKAIPPATKAMLRSREAAKPRRNVKVAAQLGRRPRERGGGRRGAGEIGPDRGGILRDRQSRRKKKKTDQLDQLACTRCGDTHPQPSSDNPCHGEEHLQSTPVATSGSCRRSHNVSFELDRVLG